MQMDDARSMDNPRVTNNFWEYLTVIFIHLCLFIFFIDLGQQSLGRLHWYQVKMQFMKSKWVKKWYGIERYSIGMFANAYFVWRKMGDFQNSKS